MARTGVPQRNLDDPSMTPRFCLSASCLCHFIRVPKDTPQNVASGFLGFRVDSPCPNSPRGHLATLYLPTPSGLQ